VGAFSLKNPARKLTVMYSDINSCINNYCTDRIAQKALSATRTTSSPTEEQEADKMDAIQCKLPIRMVSTVVRGFGRGSSDLGIPTANLDREGGKFGGASFEELPTGIYWGFGRIGEDPFVYKTACSIGYNPTYGNTVKTIEPHLIAPPQDQRRSKSSCHESVLDEFYDQPIRLSLVGYMRPELPFEGLDKLIEAIKNDITMAELLGDRTDEVTLKENAWVASEEEIETGGFGSLETTIAENRTLFHDLAQQEEQCVSLRQVNK
jgi:riboflavin kinase